LSLQAEPPHISAWFIASLCDNTLGGFFAWQALTVSRN
jgi:hypothetical protein